jgi:hypothetical protein
VRCGFAFNNSTSASIFGERAPLRQNSTVCARSWPFGSACTLSRFASGNVPSTLRGISATPMPATRQPSIA